jgi:hypothetical protein
MEDREIINRMMDILELVVTGLGDNDAYLAYHRLRREMIEADEREEEVQAYLLEDNR